MSFGVYLTVVMGEKNVYKALNQLNHLLCKIEINIYKYSEVSETPHAGQNSGNATKLMETLQTIAKVLLKV